MCESRYIKPKVCIYISFNVYIVVPTSFPNGSTSFDETWFTASSLTELHHCRGKYSLTQSHRLEWGKTSKMHVTNRHARTVVPNPWAAVHLWTTGSLLVGRGTLVTS
ncbi:hypothetical protein AVEN_83718-1 [Araneus ventricosus]|uniref:Uncharacterized protein n=1 Tax=Araneus ventricosus TaxID=182803 RepID=A0A4Y2EXX1_ARAVE|nr:hypothetical protein AVEN_83718-1 [Araneus ventricosus]